MNDVRGGFCKLLLNSPISMEVRIDDAVTAKLRTPLLSAVFAQISGRGMKTDLTLS